MLRWNEWYSGNNENSYDVSIGYCSIELKQHFDFWTSGLLRFEIVLREHFAKTYDCFSWKRLRSQNNTFPLSTETIVLSTSNNF